MQSTNPDPLRWWALALLCAAQFIVILDTSIIGVALPAIQIDLGFDPQGLSWIFNAYVIAFGGLLLLGGKLGDVAGARRMFILGFAILSTASLLAGLATTRELLIAGRALQGVGAALIAPSALAIIMRLFGNDGSELGKAFGFWGAAAAAGGTAGVFLGGVITEWLHWPWTFLINVPLGLVVLAASPIVLRHVPSVRGQLGVPSALIVTAALVTAVYAIVTTEPGAWTSTRALGLIAGALVLFVAFVALQMTSREPLLPMRIFRTPNLAWANALMALLGAAWIPLWFFLNLYLQQTLQLSAFNSGLALLPMTLLIMVLMIGVTGRLVGRFGIKVPLTVGLLAMAGALLMFANVPAAGSYWIAVLPASLLAAAGMSLAYIPITMAGMMGARPEEMGLASGLINTTYQIGSAVGLAVMVSLAASQHSTGDAPAQAELLAGFQLAFLGAAVVAAIGAACALVGLRASAVGQSEPAE